MTANRQTLFEKKAYEKPSLRVYGDVRSITQTNPSGTAAPDGGGGSHKTHV
jgi:hypothetical protein